MLALQATLAPRATLAAQIGSREPVSPRIGRLERWLSVVERHQPGVIDDDVLEISRWSPQELRVIWIDVVNVVSLVREPDISIFFVSESVPGRPGSPNVAQQSQRPRTQVLYTVAELRSLKEIARRLTMRAADAESDVLRRGAMLHGDIAMLVPPEGRSTRGDGTWQRFVVRMNDGQQTGLEESASHWEMGRRLLDRVRPAGKVLRDSVSVDPGSDPFVRIWYLASEAYLQGLMLIEPSHIERALQLFPRDADILFFAGAHHESAASPRIQATLKTAKLPRGIDFAVRDEGTEFRLAEQLYRRALEANPGHVEARIRLGRVLAKRGRHQEALEHLREASAKATEPMLQYYAALHIGAAAEARGNEDEARQSYQRALSFYPDAQSPMLSLSRLATQAGDRAAARDAMELLLNLSPFADERVDPWWIYDISQGRNAESLLTDLRSRIRPL
jgi:tetratricopeptide (TPR) repeat protein